MSFFKKIEQDLISLAATFTKLPAEFKAALPVFVSLADKTAPLVETGLALSGNAAAAATTQAVVTALDASVSTNSSNTKDALQSTLQTASQLAHAVGAPALADHINNVATAIAAASPIVATSINPEAVTAVTAE